MDHDQRRRRIAEIVVQVIAREGLEAATVRRIAAEIGYSTAVVTHYFTDKKELLLWTYRTLGEIGLSRFRGTAFREPADLVNMLLSMTAGHDGEYDLWRTFIAIWEMSLHDPAILAELNLWTCMVSKQIAEAARILNPACKAPERSAKRLLALVNGISVQCLSDPESWSSDTLRDALESEVELLLGVSCH